MMETFPMMRLKATTAHFLTSEGGAVTVDWVVLTAALVGLGLAVMAVVSGGTEDLSSDIDTQLVDQGIVTEFEVAFAGLTAATLSSWHHNEGWYNDMSGRYSDPAQYSEAQLITQHAAMAATILAANPAHIQSGHYQNAIDHMGAIEIGMAANGIEVPAASGINYETAYTQYQSS